MTEEEKSGESTYSSTRENEWKPWERRHAQGKYDGPVAPVVASILAIIAWCVFILLYALYWSEGFNMFQNIILTVVSLFITGLLIGLMWVILGSRKNWFMG